MEFMVRPDVSSPAAPVGVRRGLTLRVMAVAAVILALILAHWTYPYANGIPLVALPMAVVIAEVFIFLFACTAVLFGGVLLALDFGLARLGLKAKRHLHLINVLVIAGVFAMMSFDAGDEDHTSPYIVFSIGTVLVTYRDLLLLSLGVILWSAVNYALATLGFTEFRKSTQHDD